MYVFWKNAFLAVAMQMSVIIIMCTIVCQQVLPLNNKTHTESREECGTSIGFSMKYRDMNGGHRKEHKGMGITLCGEACWFFLSTCLKIVNACPLTNTKTA